MNIVFDSEQQHLLHEIQRHLAMMCADNTRKSVLSLFSRKSTRSGIYLYGDVGRGKTTLIGHVFDQLHVSKKRYHCDVFFANLLHILKSKNIDEIVYDIHHKYRVIWIDELQIYDIATAMLLRRLIPALVEHHVIILMTGNIAPEDFYKGGLNREQFMDFIPYFCESFYCLPLNGAVDYRLQPKVRQQNIQTQKKLHFWLVSFKATEIMESIFEAYASTTKSTPFVLQLNHRIWNLAQTNDTAVFISFSELAEKARAFDDYTKLIQRFPIVFVTDVPIFNSTNRDACRRFMAFIDILYDLGAELYMSAYAAPEKLYQDPDNKLPFARTASRLKEIL